MESALSLAYDIQISKVQFQTLKGIERAYGVLCERV